MQLGVVYMLSIIEADVELDIIGTWSNSCLKKWLCKDAIDLKKLSPHGPCCPDTQPCKTLSQIELCGGGTGLSQ